MVYVLLGLVALGVALLGRAVARGDVPLDLLRPAVRTMPDSGLPPVPSSADVDAVRLDAAAWGYRMGETDSLLDDLRDRLAEQEAEIARHRSGEL